MGFVSKINVKGITAHSPQQAEAIKILLDLGFTQNKEKFTSDFCALILESQSGCEVIVDCDGLVNKKQFEDFKEEYISWLFKKVDECGERQ